MSDINMMKKMSSDLCEAKNITSIYHDCCHACVPAPSEQKRKVICFLLFFCQSCVDSLMMCRLAAEAAADFMMCGLGAEAAADVIT